MELADIEAAARQEEARILAALAGRLAWSEATPTPLPRAVRVQDLPEEQAVQAEFSAGLGALAVGQVIEKDEQKTVSIVDHLAQAARGETAALGDDALLALVEAILEVGVNEVKLERGPGGQFTQHGHTMNDVLKNTIQFHPGNHPVLHEVTRTEALGLSTMNMLESSGYFDQGYVWVAPRLVPTGVPARALMDYGYFENLAVSWGVVWKDKDGTFMMRTLFTAGVTAEDYEERDDRAMTPEELEAMMENRLARRHDIEAVSKMYQALGLPVPDDITGFQRGFILPASRFAHPGEYDVDIAKLYDAQLGPEFFLGRPAPAQDYVAHSRQSIMNMRKLEAKKQAVIAEMLPYHGQITDEMAVGRLLAKLARKHAIDYVIDHPEVDARPLGRAAAKLREEYQWCLANGDPIAAHRLRAEIHKIARVNTCGFGEPWNHNAELDGERNNESEELSGTIRCINCRRQVPKRKVVKKDCWECPKCNHKVDICSGEILRQGKVPRKVRVANAIGKLLGKSPEKSESDKTD